MAKRAHGKKPHEHCKKYLIEHKRIRNKTKKMQIRLKDIKPDIQEVIKKNCRIGREKEGYKMEDFKCKPSKKLIMEGNIHV